MYNKQSEQKAKMLFENYIKLVRLEIVLLKRFKIDSGIIDTIQIAKGDIINMIEQAIYR